MCAGPAQTGDQPAIDRLFELTLAHVERAVHFEPGRIIGPDESERDLVQKVSLRVFMKLGQFQGAGDDADDEQVRRSFIAWVRQIVQSVVSNVGQKQGRRKALLPQVPLASATEADQSTATGGVVPVSPELTPSLNVRRDESSRMVMAALAQIPDDVEREVVRLRFFEALSLHQIAERLGLTYDVARARCSAGMKQLQQDLAGLR